MIGGLKKFDEETEEEDLSTLSVQVESSFCGVVSIEHGTYFDGLGADAVEDSDEEVSWMKCYNCNRFLRCEVNRYRAPTQSSRRALQIKKCMVCN